MSSRSSLWERIINAIIAALSAFLGASGAMLSIGFGLALFA